MPSGERNWRVPGPSPHRTARREHVTCLQAQPLARQPGQSLDPDATAEEGFRSLRHHQGHGAPQKATLCIKPASPSLVARLRSHPLHKSAPPRPGCSARQGHTQGHPRCLIPASPSTQGASPAQTCFLVCLLGVSCPASGSVPFLSVAHPPAESGIGARGLVERLLFFTTRLGAS